MPDPTPPFASSPLPAPLGRAAESEAVVVARIQAAATVRVAELAVEVAKENGASATRTAWIDVFKTCLTVGLPAAAAVATDVPRLVAGLF